MKEVSQKAPAPQYGWKDVMELANSDKFITGQGKDNAI